MAREALGIEAQAVSALADRLNDQFSQAAQAILDGGMTATIAQFPGQMAVLGVESALYSILTYMAAARTLDFIIHGIEEYTAMTIMSDRSEFIRRRITGELGRGVTVYRARGGMSGDEREILYCVITRLEISRVRTIIREVDERAFVITHPLADVQGGTVRKRALH